MAGSDESGPFGRQLITGANGLLGPYLVEAAAKGEVIQTSRGSGDIRADLCDPQATAALIADTRPDVVLHCAALTDVELCESDPEAAFAANALAVKNLVEALPRHARLVMISTDQVYADTPGPHVEGKDEAPENAYGRSKLKGEAAARSHPGGLVLRTNFFGPSRTAGRESLSDFVVRSLEAGRIATFFQDVWFSPLHMATLAQLILKSVKRKLTGVYNLGCRHGLSKLEFALAIGEHLGLSTAAAAAGAARDIPGRVPRPFDLRMDVTRIERALGRSMPTLREEIAKL